MADTDEVVVAIEPELPLGDEKPAEKPAADDAVADLQSQFKELQSQSERDKAARAEALQRATNAEADAQRARQEAATARTEVFDASLTTVESGLDAAKTESKAARAAYKAAMEAGDFEAAGEAQERIAAAQARIVRLDEAKSDIEARKAAPETKRSEQPIEASQVRQPPADPVEAFISGPLDASGRRRPAETQTWLRDHKDYISEPRKFAKLQAAHHDAIASDIAPDTPEYFAHVETFVGLRKAEGTNGKQEPAPKPARRASVPAAPVQSSGGGTSGGAPTVRLTRGEEVAANDGTHVWNYDDPSPQKRFKKGDPIGTQEFARRKLEMTKQGLYDRSYLEQ